MIYHTFLKVLRNYLFFKKLKVNSVNFKFLGVNLTPLVITGKITKQWVTKLEMAFRNMQRKSF